MDTVALSVSAAKGTTNRKKNSEMRVERMKLSSEIVEKVAKTQFEAFVLKFNEAANVEEQVHLIREMASSEPDSLENLKLELVVLIYLECPPKHAVRGALVKLMQNPDLLNPEWRTVFKTCLSNYLNKQKELVVSWSDALPSVSCLFGIFENKIVTKEVVVALSTEIFVHLENVFRLAVVDYCLADHAPSQKNEILLAVHTVLRALLFLCHESGHALADQHKSDDNLIALLNSLIFSDDTPMDTKVNCGHLGVMIVKELDAFDQLVKFNRRAKEVTMYVFCTNVGIVSDFSNGSLAETDECWTVLCTIVNQNEKFLNANAVHQEMVLAAARLNCQISKTIQTLPTFKYPEALYSLVDMQFRFVLGHLSSFMDSVRHQCRDSLRQMLTFTKSANLEVIPKLIDSTTTTSKSIRFTTISIIAQVYTTSEVLVVCPTIGKELIESFCENHYDVTAASCYEVLMSGHDVKLSLWVKLWIQPIVMHLQGLETSDHNAKTLIENLINKTIKRKPQLAVALMDAQEIPINIRLSVLSTARKCGLFDDVQSTDSVWKGTLDIEVIKNAMVSFDDRIRIQSLKLMTDTRKTTEPFSKIELDLILFFLEFNCNCQSPATRDQILCLFRSVVARLNAVAVLATKNNDQEQSETYAEFVEKLRMLCFNNLQIHGNFSRRLISLKLLFEIYSTLIESCSDGKQEYSSKQIDSLIECLRDSYVINKQLALNTLCLLKKQCVLAKHTNLEPILNLMLSTNPSDSETAAYHLDLLVSAANDNMEILSVKLFMTLFCCMNNAVDGVLLAKKSLAKAAVRNPIYGSLHCVRHLISKFDLMTVLREELRLQAFRKLINLCYDSSKAVESIVYDVSPEGNLPTSESDEVIEQMTPQSFLRLGFGTIKEVSLLFGVMSLYPIRQGSTGLITVDQLREMGEYFMKLLTEAKPRGVIEQGSFAFFKLCCRLWQSPEPELHELPMKWLKELINDIPEAINKKLSATRRSAGVPFLFEALIVSESRVCKSKALKYAMENLFEMCGQESTMVEGRVHIINILTALFRCTQLSETIVEYVSRGLKLAILSSGAIDWAEHTAATRLLSVLVTRIFGVQRTRDPDTLPLKNKMTGRIFFQRYPELYDFFLAELRTIVDSLTTKTKCQQLFSMLTIFNRLYPSTLEGTETSLSLNPFVDLIELCGKCRDMKTRVLAAKAIGSLLPISSYWDRVLSNLNAIRLNSSTNEKESRLLNVYHLLLNVPVKSNWPPNMNEILLKFIRFSIPFDAILLIKLFLETMLLFLQQFNVDAKKMASNTIFMKNLVMFEEYLCECAEKTDETMGMSEVGGPYVIACMTLQKGGALDERTFINYLKQRLLCEGTLRIILLIIAVWTELPENMFFEDWEYRFVNGLEENSRAALTEKILDSEELFDVIKSLALDKNANVSYDLRNTALTTLSHSRCQMWFSKKQLMCKESSVHGKMCMFKFYCNRNRNDFKPDYIDFEIVYRLSTINNSRDVRRTSALILSKLPIRKWINANHLINVMQYARLVLLLLRDDDADIRQSVCATVRYRVTNFRGKDSWVELYAQERFIMWLVHELKNFTSGNAAWAVFIAVLVVAESAKAAKESDLGENEGRMFDESEANQFGEQHSCVLQLRKACALEGITSEQLRAQMNRIVVKDDMQCVDEEDIQSIIQDLF